MTHHRQNLTAIIFSRKGKILSIGKNSYSKTHPMQASYATKAGEPDKIYLHAEISALVRLSPSQKKLAHHIHVIRISRAGKELHAKPCKTCMAAIESFGISRITHS